MTGIEMEPTPPATATDMLGAIVADACSPATPTAATSRCCSTPHLEVEGEDCSISFVLVPDQGGVDLLLEPPRLG